MFPKFGHKIKTKRSKKDNVRHGSLQTGLKHEITKFEVCVYYHEYYEYDKLGFQYKD